MVEAIMAAEVICMASAKGGSGKTVLSATFAAFLVNLGKRVLLIDTDAATNGLTLMFLKETRMQADLALAQRRVARGIYELRSTSDRPEIVTTPAGINLIPATYSFTNTELVATEQFDIALHGTLAAIKEDYDFIFLDAQAGADSIAHVAMSQRHSDQVVIVSEYDPLSAAGVERLKGLFREDLTYVRTWILLNKMLPDFVKSFSDFMEVAKYASPIPWDADVVRAYARRRLALDLERGNEFTLAVLQSLRSILGDKIGPQLDNWLQTRASALREPIEIQYKDAKRELESLIWERKSALFRRTRNRYLYLVQGVLVGGAVSVATLYLSTIEKWLPDPLFAKYLRWLSPLLGALAAVLGFFFFRFTGQRFQPLEQDMADVRFELQEDMIKERLRKLEALKSADVAVLLKQGRS
jgi:cellulose biosynthesis protein BcsQ